VNETFDLIIVGGGPAGLAAGLYAARMKLNAVLVDRGPLGGQLLNTELIEDYPGFESILGGELAEKMGAHARKFGLDVREFQPVSEVDVEPDGTKVVRLEFGGELRAPAAILAAGGLPRRLGAPGEEELAGRGVSYCAVCDGAFFKGEHLVVVGGGDAALEEGDFLTRYASKVTIIHRREEFRAQPILQERARANPKIEFVLKAQVREIYGQGNVEGVRYVQDGVEKDLAAGGVFIFVGFIPTSDILKPHAEHDEAGYILTDRNLETSIEGLWAVGDVRAQLTKQISTAVGDGTTAAVAASQHVERLRDGERAASVSR
jgi:thioredoxin reductase (NADPH)